MFIEATKDGYVFGFDLPGIDGTHLTVIFKEGRFGPHISDKEKIKPPWGEQFEPEFITRIIIKYLDRWKRHYHGNMRCWVATDKLIQKIQSHVEPALESGEYPLELTRSQIVFDPENSERWQRAKIRDIIGKPVLAFIEDEGVLRRVEPLDDNTMLCYSERQHDNMLEEIIKSFGFDKYIEYMVEKYGQEILQDKIIDKIQKNIK